MVPLHHTYLTSRSRLEVFQTSTLLQVAASNSACSFKTTILCDVCLQAFPSHGPIPRTAPGDAPFDGFTYPNDPASSVNSYYHESQLIPHHPSFPSLKASVELNCLICSAFWNQ